MCVCGEAGGGGGQFENEGKNVASFSHVGFVKMFDTLHYLSADLCRNYRNIV